jgi:hypothetical protein
MSWIGVKDGGVDPNGVKEGVADWIYIVATTTTYPPWNLMPSTEPPPCN